MKEVTINQKEEETIKKNSTEKNDKAKSTQSQAQDESMNLAMVGKWNISESPSAAYFTETESQTIQVPLPMDAYLTVRFGEELRRPEDGASPYRVVYRLPAPEESPELASPTAPASRDPPMLWQASSEAKQRTTNDSVEEKAVLPKEEHRKE